jgi:predicted CXXCH cytochrome family protein
VRPARGLLAAAALAITIGAIAIWLERPRPTQVAQGPQGAVATYVGSSTCAECHSREAEAWRNSQHAAAMSAVTEKTVLGRFDEARVTYAGVTSTFFRRGGRLFVRTDGPDGRLADFEIAYTFGVFPLQQYLIPRPGGRLQALGLAWDARPSADGGQRWFHLYPRQAIKAGDPLHWTGLEQNWNSMCADCHATNLRKGYDPGTREFHTTWSELGVGCEACHGPGSAHVERERHGGGGADAALPPARLDERRGIRWAIDPSTGNPARSQPRRTEREIDVCARCHSRRSQMTDAASAGGPLEAAFRPALLEPPLFYADGQQKEEVYDYASFLESRMYADGVTCSDCHDAHSGQLRLEGNQLCTQCHAQARYDAPSHHFHRPGTPAAGCVTCHMPAATFMVIDQRHDHSFRVPRPDLGGTLGVPNTCTTGCHAGRSVAWAASAIRRRSGRAPAGFQRFANAFAAADHGDAGATSGLLNIAGDSTQPAIVRASALARLARADSWNASAVASLLGDASSMVRRGAAGAMAHADDSTRARLLAPLLHDPIRTVRTEAALALADLADRALPGAEHAEFERAFDEFVAEQQFNADRPEAQSSLGQLLIQRGRTDGAIAAFDEAIRLDRTFVPAYVDLADAYRIRSDEPGAERTLRQALEISPASAALHHALGLALVRQHRLAGALTELARAATLEPATARYSYVYAVALHDSGKGAGAIDVLAAAVRRHPDDRDMLFALATYLEEAGRVAEARDQAARLLALDPADSVARDLAARLGAR